MPDVFLSYSREDQATARQVAENFAREGFDVWWDQSLRSGEAYDKVTEAALREAGAVVVLWSKKSVDSRWVRAEATTAARRATLMPVMIEDCERPIMFELTHTADLSHWKGESDDPAWRAFLTDVRRFIENGRKPASPVMAQAPVLAKTVVPRRSGLIVAIAAAVLLVSSGIFWLTQQRREKLPAAAPPAVAQTGPVTLAVLPFADLSQAKDQEYFSDGLTEEILNQLAQIPALRLTGRTSSFSFKGRNEDLRVIGKKLGVANLLEGSVRRDGKELRVTAQLIRADEGTHMWSKTYVRAMENVLAMQDEIAKDVAQALSVKLDVATLNRAQGGTTNVEAYDRFLQWRKLALSERFEPEVNRQKLKLLREAVALDPGFALAWDGLAETLNGMAYRVPAAQAEQLRAEATQARARAAATAPDSWMVRREQAYTLWSEGKFAEALAVAEAIKKAGPLTWEHTYPYVNLLFAVGRLEEGVTLVSQLLAIEPLDMYMSRDQQWNLFAARRFDEAEAEYQRSRTLDGDHTSPDLLAFLRLLAREDAEPQALRVLHRKLVEGIGSRTPGYLRELGELLHDREAMRAVLRKDFEVRRDPSVASFADALGDADLALAALSAKWKGRNPDFHAYWQLWLSPNSSMRTLPGYKELMREVGLADYWQKTGDWGDVCRPVGKDDFECK